MGEKIIQNIKTVSPQRARRVIRETPIKIRQEFTEPYDFLSAINYGDQIILSIPTLYYSVKESEDHYYIFYGLYHCEDSTHRHDYEGLMYRRSKKNNEPSNYVLITRSHYNLHFYIGQRSIGSIIKIGVEGGGHGIKKLKITNSMTNHIYYGTFDFQNMQLKRFQKQWDNFFDKANGVQSPIEWVDTTIENYIKKNRYKVLKKYGIKTSEGLFWNDPDTLISIANDMGRIKI